MIQVNESVINDTWEDISHQRWKENDTLEDSRSLWRTSSWRDKVRLDDDNDDDHNDCDDDNDYDNDYADDFDVTW